MRLFEEKIYTERRKALMTKMGGGLILIMGNAEAPMNYKDNIYHFRQNSNFLYYFGIQQPDLNAIIDIDNDKIIIYGHENSIDDIIWVGDVPPLSELAKSVGVDTVKSENALIGDIKSMIAAGQELHYLPPYRMEHYVILNEALGYNKAESLEKKSVKLIKAVSTQRSIKSSIEVAEISNAVAITKSMHEAAMRFKSSGKYEYEAVAQILEECKKHNGSLAYGVIFSINGQVLHNHYHHNKMVDGRMIINDSGAENDMCYAADITRSFPVNGKFTSKQRDIYNIVLEMEKTSISSLKPALSYRDVHMDANRVLINRFKELNLLKGNTDEMVELGVGGMFMPHGLGHMMGLDVHDMEDLGEQYIGYAEGQERSTLLGLKSLRLAKELEAGYVLTVEPGIYFIPQLIEKYKAEGKFLDYVNYDALKSYYDFGGIRIEDNILITDQGQELIGDYIPKELAEVEAMCQS
jgi:Xaa-Pro aminopeptidase